MLVPIVALPQNMPDTHHNPVSVCVLCLTWYSLYHQPIFNYFSQVALLNCVDATASSRIFFSAQNYNFLFSITSCHVLLFFDKVHVYFILAVPYPGATTALHLATKNKHCDCVKELILNGADYNATNQYGHTSLYIAAMQGSEDIVLTHLRNAVGRDILSLPVKDSSKLEIL